MTALNLPPAEQTAKAPTDVGDPRTEAILLGLATYCDPKKDYQRLTITETFATYIQNEVFKNAVDLITNVCNTMAFKKQPPKNS